MYDEIIIARLETCLEHIVQVQNYLQTIMNAHEFALPQNAVYCDATLMRLQALGENIKAISIKHPDVIVKLSYKDINNFIRFRDLVSHHYEKLQSEIIYEICTTDLPILQECLLKLIETSEAN